MSLPASFPSPGGQAENQGTAAFAADPIQAQNDGADASASSKGSKKGKKTVAGPRRVRLSLTRINPLSVMKVSFLLSVAAIRLRAPMRRLNYIVTVGRDISYFRVRRQIKAVRVMRRL